MKKQLILPLSLIALSCNAPSASTAHPTPQPFQYDTDVDPLRLNPQPAAKLDPRSPEQIAQSACFGPDGWHCRTPQPVVRASTATAVGPIIPTSWTVPNWFVDPANVSGTASDNNNCTTSTTACLTWQEINVHRWGCLGSPVACPRLRQTTLITFLSSHTDNTDPIYFLPAVENSSFATIQGAAPTVVTSGVVLSGTVSKNRTAGSNSLLQTNLGATGAVGQLVQNTTHPSMAWVYKSLGSNNFSITQPFVPTTATGTNAPAEVDTWANSDTVNLLTPVSVNISAFKPLINGGFGGASAAFLYQLKVFDPLGTAGSSAYLGQISLHECSSSRAIASNPSGESLLVLTNVFNTGGIGAHGGDAYFIGGALTGNILVFLNGQVDLDGDFIDGVPSASGITVQSAYRLNIGVMYLDGSLALGTSQTFFLNLPPYNTSIIYGSTGTNSTINMFGDAHGTLNNIGATFTGTFTAPKLVSPGIQINSSSAACSHTNASPDVINCNIATTPANLDAATGATGFGKDAFQLGGASIANY